MTTQAAEMKPQAQGNGTEKKPSPAAPDATATASRALVHFDPQTATEAWDLARYYNASQLMPTSLKGPADIFVTIMSGRDFGWSPMQSIRGIHVVEGRPSLSADAMVAIAKKSGLCEYFRCVKSDDKEAIFETKRKGDPEPTKMGFTAEEAKTAGLLDRKGPWQTYRRRMLRNRAKSILCKEVYEDLFFGTYEEEEAREVAEFRQIGVDVAEPVKTTGSEGLKATLKASETTVDAAASSEPDAEEIEEIRAREAAEARAE